MNAYLSQQKIAAEALDPLKDNIASMEIRFLGTPWVFILCRDELAYWLNARTGTLLESSRNQEA